VANPPVVIDTNAFYDRDFMRWLRTYRGEKEVPPVVYCELAVSTIRRTGDTSKLDAMLFGAGIQVSEMLMIHAQYAASFAQADADWKVRWRDYMIASHAAIPPTYVVTENVKDFQCLGARAVRPAEFRRGIENRTIR
jgi:predicted nucleic acid-binding protein